MKDKHGREYGWGVAEYATAEQQMGAEFSSIYAAEPGGSYAKVLDHLRSIFPDAPKEAIERFLK